MEVRRRALRFSWTEFFSKHLEHMAAGNSSMWDTIGHQAAPAAAAAAFLHVRAPLAVAAPGSAQMLLLLGLPAGQRQSGQAGRVDLGRVFTHPGQDVPGADRRHCSGFLQSVRAARVAAWSLPAGCCHTKHEQEVHPPTGCLQPAQGILVANPRMGRALPSPDPPLPPALASFPRCSYKDDVALLRALGLRNFRFSLSWTRIFPNGTGAVNQVCFCRAPPAPGLAK